MLASGPLPAGVLAPGATISLSGTTFGMDPELGGGIRYDELVPFEIRNAAGDVFISGTFQDSVVLSTLTQNLIFNRNVRDLSATSGTARITAIMATDFAGLNVTAEYRVDGFGDIGPESATRSGGAGDQVRFDYPASGVAPPDNSRNCFCKTNANGFALGASVTIVAVESPGGPEFSVTLENRAQPQLLPTDRIIVTSVRQSDASRIEIKWLGLSSEDYEIYAAPSPDGPWTYRGADFGRANPRDFEVFVSSGVTSKSFEFYRVSTVP